MSKPITVSIVGNAGPLKKSLGEADNALGKFGDSMKKFGLIAAAGVGALAAGIGAAAKSAAADQKAFTQLSNTIRNVTGATHKQIKAVDEQIDVMQRATGIADDQLRPAFEALVRGTRDVDVAMSQMNLVVDVSTALQMDAATVADALAKAQQGNTKALKALSPEMAAMIKEGASMNEILEVLTANFDGSASAAADTFEGRMARLQIAFGEIVEQIGYVFLPILEKVAAFITDRVVPIVQEFADAFSEEGLAGVLTLSTDKFFDFYENANVATKAVIAGTVAIGGMVLGMKSLMFIQTVTTAFNVFTASVGRSTVAVAGFQATAVAAFSVIAAVAATALLAIDTMFKDGGYYARQFFGSVAAFINIIIASVEVAANAINFTLNSLISAYNLLNPFNDIPLLPTNVKLGRVPEPQGPQSLGSTARNEAPSAGRFDPDFPTVPAPSITVPSVIVSPETETPTTGGGKGGGTAKPIPVDTKGFVGISPSSDISGGGGGGFGAAMGNEALLDGMTGGVVNITVNTVTADANLPTLIVEALQTYNLHNGPVDVEIAA